MSKKLLIDLIKLRELGEQPFEAYDKTTLANKTFKSIRELASFHFSCRRCKDAPCIDACPVNAIEKKENEVISRSLNLCIRCKSCIVMCPFGTMSHDLFRTKTSGINYYDISDEAEMKKFAEAFSDEVVRLVDSTEKPDHKVYQLGEHVMVKDVAWNAT